MSQIETIQTVGAVSTDLVTISISDGATEVEMHFTADEASTANCAAGDCHLVVKKQSGMAPVVKSFTTSEWYTDFGAPIVLGAAVSGNDVVISVPGVALRTIDWRVTIGI